MINFTYITIFAQLPSDTRIYVRQLNTRHLLNILIVFLLNIKFKRYKATRCIAISLKETA